MGATCYSEEVGKCSPHTLHHCIFSSLLSSTKPSFVPTETKKRLIIVFSFRPPGLASNSLVSFIVMRQCTRKSMTNTGPSPRNLYIVNLSIADLALCALTIPFTILSLVKKSFIFNTVLYKIMPLVQGANFMVTSGTITAIALDR